MISAEPREYLKVPEVARMLGISNASVWRLVWSGALPSVRVSERVVRIRRTDLDRWLESRAAGARRGPSI